MKFAHLSDCHVGGWREPKLREAGILAFCKAVDICIEENTDFVLIAGDLFNTSMPALGELKRVVEKLKELERKSVPVYAIPGSHDFSPSGKSMIDILEKAGLLINVVKGQFDENTQKLKLKFTIDEKTGAKITGLLGKKGGLDKFYYEYLDRESLEKESGYKIFMFHGALQEYKPKELELMEAQPVSLFPKGFDYYAGGHVHCIFSKYEDGYGIISYPGALFPNNFAELEKFGRGGFYMVNDGIPEWRPVQIYNAHNIHIDCENKTPEQVNELLLNEIKDKEFNSAIVLIRLEGTLKTGRIKDIDLKTIIDLIYKKSAHFVMRSASKLKNREFEEVKIDTRAVDEIENSLIEAHKNELKINGFDILGTVKELMHSLSQERLEGEHVADFENRIKAEVKRILEID